MAGEAAKPLWHGRFGEGPADALMALSVSLPFDQRLAHDDLVGSRAHVDMLASVGLLTEEERFAIAEALDDMRAERGMPPLLDATVADADRDTLGDHLRPLGRVPEHDLRALYAGAVLFCFPSLHEGFGLPVLEAMVQGTPVACADVPALRELAGGAARLVPPTDAGAWADTIADLLDRPEEAAALAAVGTARAAEFSWSRTAAATLAVYAEALGRA